MNKSVIGIIFVLIFITGCVKDTTETIKDIGELNFSTPEKQGMSSSVLNTAYEKVLSYSFVDGLIIAKNGFIIGEQYFNGYDKTKTHNVKSVSKSILSIITGMAIEDGSIPSLDAKMMDYFPEYKTSSLDPRKLNITVEHLLSMRMGILSEVGNENSVYFDFYNSSNWIKKTIEYPLAHSPGTQMNYNTFQTHLLSVLVAKATHKNAKDYATEVLFKPMKIDLDGWEKDPQGNYFGGNSMRFTLREMYLFGKLYHNGGKLYNTQIVPKKWIDKSLSITTNFNQLYIGAFKNYNYGYLWWLGEINTQKMYLAYGYGGQFVVVFPDLDLIIVTTTNNEVSAAKASSQEVTLFDFISQQILPAIQ